MPIAKLDGININYRVDGQGEPLVMIMGFGSSMGASMNQVSFFKKHYRIITFDNRGVGKSDKPQGPYSMKMMSEDTVKLMDYLGIEKTHVLGASMGGMIAQELAINYPQRIKKLVLACTSANLKDNGKPEELKKHMQENNNSQMIDPTMMIGLSFNKPLYKYTALFFGKISMMFSGSKNDAGFAGQGEACSNHNTLDRLQFITAPTLVIVGTKDKLILPVSSEVIASKIPNAKLVKLRAALTASSWR